MMCDHVVRRIRRRLYVHNEAESHGALLMGNDVIQFENSRRRRRNRFSPVRWAIIWIFSGRLSCYLVAKLKMFKCSGFIKNRTTTIDWFNHSFCLTIEIAIDIGKDTSRNQIHENIVNLTFSITCNVAGSWPFSETLSSDAVMPVDSIHEAHQRHHRRLTSLSDDQNTRKQIEDIIRTQKRSVENTGCLSSNETVYMGLHVKHMKASEFPSVKLRIVSTI